MGKIFGRLIIFYLKYVYICKYRSKNIHNQMTKSYHIFYFPFIVKTEGEIRFSDLVNLSRMGADNEWKRVLQTEESENYDEKMYYHHFVHNAMYDNGGVFEKGIQTKNKGRHKDLDTSTKKNLIYQYEANLKEGLEFRIRKEKKEGDEYKFVFEYSLKIDRITLDYYFTEVGILSLYISNDQYTSPQDILNINYYGRRLYKTYQNDSEKITLSLLGQSDDLMNVQTPYSLSGHVKGLLDNFFEVDKRNLKPKYLPIFDNRMYVSCCLVDNELSNKLRFCSLSRLSNDIFWQNFVEVDCDDSFGCQNESMRMRQTQRNSYLRWQNFGTLYGITDRSFVCLISEGEFAETTVTHMRTIYSQMVKLVLVQRASLLKFSDDINSVDIEKNTFRAADHISKIYRDYIVYMKQLYFREVTSQIQGVELYNMFQSVFDIKERIESCNEELNKMHTYLSTLKDVDKKDEQNKIFNIWAGACLPITLITGVLGMNKVFNLDTLDFDRLKFDVDFIVNLCVVFLFTFIVWILLYKNNAITKSLVKESKKIKGGLLVLFIVFLALVLILYTNLV